jgi:hypothetical protein
MVQLSNDFDSFCTRMWLDNEDENLNLPASGNRMDRDEYVERWHEWLLEKWQDRKYGTNDK